MKTNFIHDGDLSPTERSMYWHTHSARSATMDREERERHYVMEGAAHE
jgi:hypothetical protein